MTHWIQYFKRAGLPVQNAQGRPMDEEIAQVMERHGLRVYDLEFIHELIEKTVLRDQKECSH